MNRLRIYALKSLVYSAAVIFSVQASAFTAIGQAEAVPIDAPPPMRVMSPEERETLDRSSGVRVRTQTALRLMETRIKTAEDLNAKGNSGSVFEHLGAFHAIIDDTLDFLGANEKMTGRILDNFRRFEIGLRRFSPRLELVRRGLPASHREYLITLMKHLRDARTRATDSFYTENLIRNKDN